MALYLHCVICGRKQADGLISGAAWGRLELAADSNANGYPASAPVRVCPSCIGTHTNWQSLALSSASKAS
ncbi:MAG: hypothetical protein H0U46_01215 [Actinobacteria bacterium]|nr:hypothetical protein [Actinomycetota bacterium]